MHVTNLCKFVKIGLLINLCDCNIWHNKVDAVQIYAIGA